MAIKSLRPVRADFSMDAKLDIEVLNETELDTTEVVVPYNLVQYQLDPYRIKNGWPVEIPKFDVRCNTFVSSTGDIVSSRPHPASLATQADVRWIPTTQSWDGTSLRWHPEDGPYMEYIWTTDVEYAPTFLDEYSYRVGKEIVTRSALNFVSENREHLWSNFVGGFTGTAGYTVIMVMSATSKFGTDSTQAVYSGLLCAGHPTPASQVGKVSVYVFPENVTGATTDVQLRGRYLYARGGEMGFQQLFPVNLALTRTQPSYLAITVDPPYTKVYMGFGASSMQVGQVRTGDPQPNHLDWVLGRTTGDTNHCADMTVFDLSLYAHPLADDDLLGEIATLSQAYGG